MAKNPKAPIPLPAEAYRYEKTASYSPPQYNHMRSSGGPEKSWGGGSYSKNGRPVTFDKRPPGYGGK